MKSDDIRYFLSKLTRRIAAERKRFWPYLNMDRIAMRGCEIHESADAFKQRLSSMLGAFSSEMLSTVNEEDRKTILECAEQTMRHEFDLLGSGIVKNDPINWHVDLKTGEHWEKKFYKRIGYISGSDIKMPWELSRCQHLLWLGEAFLLSGDERYAQEIVDEIKWWIEDNPFMYSVNWTCAMDVAFRAVNWMFSLNMIVGFKGVDDGFVQEVQKSLWQHGFFIRHNLEKVIPNSNNHYSSDLVGLIYIGQLFKNTRKAKAWRNLALNELLKETRSQVLPSGVHYERTVSYHRMMTEMLSYPVYMLKREGEMLPSDVIQRIKMMYSYISNYTKPNGHSPLIGDNDDGRFAPFLKRDFRDHNYLNNPLSVENIIVSAGAKPLFCSDINENRFYEDAGVGIIREKRDYLFVNNGGYSKKPKETDMVIGTHTHNDCLSFELSLNGDDVIVDPGTYLYTSSKVDRDAFRSTSKHNTIVVDDEEQNMMGAPFELKRNVRALYLRSFNERQIEGSYTTISEKLYHYRSFTFTDGVLIISDQLKKEGSGHTAKVYLHFAEGIIPKITQHTIALNHDVMISFSLIPDSIGVIDDFISPSFGVLVKSKTAVVTFRFDNELLFETKINRI